MYKQGTLVSYFNKIGIVTDEVTQVKNIDCVTIIFKTGYKNKFSENSENLKVLLLPLNELKFKNKSDKWWIRKLKYQEKAMV